MVLFRIPPRSIGRTPTIYNVTLTNAITEYSKALNMGTKKFSVSERDGHIFRLAFESGRVAAPTEPYKTLQNQVYWEDDVNLVNTVLYFAAPVAGRVIEIICWT